MINRTRSGDAIGAPGVLAFLLIAAFPATALPDGGQPPPPAQEYVRQGDQLMQRSRDTGIADLHVAAIVAYRKALAAEPDNVEALIGLAWSHNAGHHFEAGARYARRALARSPDNVDARLLLADIAVERGDYTDALALLQESVDRRYDLAVLARASHVLWLTGESERAEDLMRQAIAAGGPHREHVAWCRAEYARMLHARGAGPEAREQLALALSEAPTNSRVLTRAGVVAFAAGDLTAAERYYERAVATAPTHEALAGLGDVYAAQGRHAEAETRYAAVVAFHHADHGDGGHPDHHASAELALFQAERGRHLDRALLEARAAYAAFANVYAADALAWAAYRNGRLDEARDAIRQALAWQTPEPAFHYHAGMIALARGERASAVAQLERALALNPAFAEAAAARREIEAVSGSHVVSDDRPAVRRGRAAIAHDNADRE